MSEKNANEFEKAASQQQSQNLLAELWGFMKQNKKWWLLPIVVALLIFGVLVVLAGTGLAPFIYTLF